MIIEILSFQLLIIVLVFGIYIGLLIGACIFSLSDKLRNKFLNFTFSLFRTQSKDQDKIKILFRIPLTRYFLAYCKDDKYRYFSLYKKRFGFIVGSQNSTVKISDEYYWEEV